MRAKATRLILFSVFLCLGVAAGVQAKKVALKDGRVMDVRTYRVQGDLVVITQRSGARISIKSELVDFNRTKRLNAEAAATPTPLPTPKKTLSLAEIARRERQRKRQVFGVPPREPTPRPPPPEPDWEPAPTPEPLVSGTTTEGEEEGGSPGPEGGENTEPAAAPAPTVTPQPTRPPMGAAQEGLPPAPATSVKKSGSKAFYLYGGFVVVALGAVAGYILVMSKRKAGAKPAAEWGHDLQAPAEPVEEGLGGDPLWGDKAAGVAEEPAEELEEPELVEELTDGEASGSPATGQGAGGTETTPAGRAAEGGPSVLGHDVVDIEIRISGETYVCPDLPTLKQWVAEGRIIENSEIKTETGQWLLAGTLPELESSFAKRRATMGF